MRFLRALITGARYAAGMDVSDSYTLKLVDQILAPLKRIESQAEKVNATMERMEKLASSGLGLAKLAAGVGVAVAGLGVLKSALGGVLDILERGAEAAGMFGKSILGAVAWRERYMTMLKHQLGDKAGATAYNKILDVSQLTPGTADEMMRSAAQLMNIGFRGEALSGALAASADIQAMFPGTDKAGTFVRGLSDMYSKRKFEEQDFKQAVTGIIPAEAAQAAILRLKGIQVAAGKVGEKFEELKKAGKVSGQEGAFGVLMAIQEKIDKGKGLGSFAVMRGAGSLEGMLSNAGEAWDNFLRKMDWDNIPGIKALKDFLQRLAPFFDHNTAQGQRLARVVQEIVNTLFGGLSRIGEKELDRFFNTGIAAARVFKRVLDGAWEILGNLINADGRALLDRISGAMRTAGELLGEGIVVAVKKALPPILGGTPEKPVPMEQWDWNSDWIPWGKMFHIGKDAPQTLRTAEEFSSRVTSGAAFRFVPQVVQAAEQAGQEGARGFLGGLSGPEGLDAHSPSRKAAKIGRWGADGFLDGLDEGHRAARDRGADGGGVRIENVHVTVNAPEGGGSRESAETFASDLVESCQSCARVFHTQDVKTCRSRRRRSANCQSWEGWHDSGYPSNPRLTFGHI